MHKKFEINVVPHDSKSDLPLDSNSGGLWHGKHPGIEIFVLFSDFFFLISTYLSLTGRSFTSAPSSKSEQFVFIEIESVEIEYIGPRMAKLASDLDGCPRARN